MSKHPEGIGIYDLDNNLISKFKNNVELAKHLNISRITVGKYLNSGAVYNKTSRFKVNSVYIYTLQIWNLNLSVVLWQNMPQ